MATFETEPTTKELYDHREEGEKETVEKTEAIYLSGSNKPTYMVGTEDVWTSDQYLCVRVAGDKMDHETEIHKIPHERIRKRKYVVKESVSEEVATSNLKDTANAEVLD